ncbi:hypothetical protein K439DRAFT_1616003 [Ramaria rubella]|nr:hypothetical protein K439DRAFT_1616003 [Ramaria rubella]
MGLEAGCGGQFSTIRGDPPHHIFSLPASVSCTSSPSLLNADQIQPNLLASVVGGILGASRNKKNVAGNKGCDAKKVEKLQEELDEILASSCPLCESVHGYDIVTGQQVHMDAHLSASSCGLSRHGGVGGRDRGWGGDLHSGYLVHAYLCMLGIEYVCHSGGSSRPAAKAGTSALVTSFVWHRSAGWVVQQRRCKGSIVVEWETGAALHSSCSDMVADVGIGWGQGGDSMVVAKAPSGRKK